MADDLELARAVLAGLQLPGIDQNARVRRLGGLTNLVFEVVGNGQGWCLRLPGKGTSEYIDRQVEAVNARAAAAAGVAPELVHFGADGVMVTRLIEDAVTMSPERLAAARVRWNGRPGRCDSCMTERKASRSGSSCLR